MGAVAGADEAEQRPQAPAQTQGAPEQAAQNPDEQAHGPGQPAVAPEAPSEQPPRAPGFAERGRMRRRARFLRRARELAYRDLGGLVFDLHRFGQRNDQLVLAKLATLRQIDTELRELEEALSERRPVTVLREVGIAACPRCAAIHGSDDRFCPGCGIAFDTNADRPISTASVGAQPHAQAAVAHPPASFTPPAPGQAYSPGQAHTPAPAATPASPLAHASTSAQAPASPLPRASNSARTPASSPAHAPTPASSPAQTPAPTPASPPTNAPTSAPTPAATPASAPPSPPSPARAPATAPPVRHPSAAPTTSDEDEPTQIIRPPAANT
jgi:hypothetical protein